MRTNLKVFRIKQHLTQEEIANRIGMSRDAWGAIENGKRSGSMEFWQKLQASFNIPDADMWQLTECEE